MKQYILRIIPNNEEISLMYMNHSHYNKGDSGIDLFCAEDITIHSGETEKIKFNISCEMICINGDTTYNVSYLLLPRSSIVKSPIRMANSVGLIDQFYRGNLIAYCDNVKFIDYKIKKGTRLFQIVAPNLNPIHHIEVAKDFLDPSKDRKGGFGSTGK